MTIPSLSQLGDGGGVRPIHARWVVEGQTELQTAAHLGRQGEGGTDMPLLRDPLEGRPLLPGTTLAGALRGYLADVLGGYRFAEAPAVSSLFGGGRGDDLGGQSPLTVLDSFGQLPQSHSIEIRDGVTIEPGSGTAEEHKKFDLEVLPAGTIFPIRLELIVPDAASESTLLALLNACLAGLSRSELWVGGRRSRGLGRLRCASWRALRFDFSTAAGVLTWLLTDPVVPISTDVAWEAHLERALQRAHSGLNLHAPDDRRDRVRFEVTLHLAGSLLVRSAATDPDAPDVVHLHSAGRPLLPGTSLAGALRARAMRIARLVRAGRRDAAAWIDSLFGPRFEGNTAPLGFIVQGSRLRVSESVIARSVPVRPSRISIDRFTQGVVPTALFDEEPQFGGELQLGLELRNPRRGEAGLLLLALKDLISGDLVLGGTASVGRGRVSGRILVHQEGSVPLDLRTDASLDATTLQQVNALIAEFHQTAEVRG